MSLFGILVKKKDKLASHEKCLFKILPNKVEKKVLNKEENRNVLIKEYSL